MINQSFIHTGNDYLPLQISQYIRKPLPLPINSILQILNKNFPPQLQKQQTYVKVIDFNNQLIYEQFQDVIDSVMTPISSSFIENGLTDYSVYPMIYNGMKKHLGKAKLYEYYMDSLQTYMEYRRKSGLDNRQKSGILIKDSLTYLAQKHLQYYGLESQFPFYINIIQKRWIQKKSKKFQMVPTLMRLGTQNQTPHQQMVQNTNLQIDDPQSPSLSSPPLSSQYRQPQFYDKNMINHIYTIMTKNYNQLIGKDTYRAKAYQVLRKHINDIRISQKNARFYHLQQEVVKQLSKAQVGFSPSVQGESNIYHEKQSWMIVLVYIYKYMQNNYDSYRRRKLKSICNSLNNSQIDRMQNWIKYLQNERQQLKTLQSNQIFMSKASSVLFDVYKERANFLKGQFQSNKDELPDFKLINLSQKKLQRKKTVNIWISGFLSQNMDKKSHWIKLTGLLKGKQIYAVQWSSDCITNLIKFIGKACIQILTADSMKQQLNKKFHENPFLPAMKVANMLGRYLAQIIVKLFPTQFVNLTGYSLGSEMIKSCVERLVQLGKQSIICSVYFLGGVSDINQLQQIVRKATYPISIFNCFTGNDSVLKNILSLCLPKAKPIGLYELTLVQGHQIINIDCSKQISGHLSYMSQYDTIGKLVGMDKD